MTPTETSELQLERDGVIRSSAWVGSGTAPTSEHCGGVVAVEQWEV